MASDVAAPTSTTVVVTAPPGSVGPVTLTVQNPNVGANANATASTSFFHYTTPGAPAIQSVTPGETQAAINFTVPASDGGAAITGYEYTLDGGTSWAAASSITSPIVIGSLTASTSYAVALRAINLAGAGTASATRSFSTNPPPPAISSVSPNTGAAAGGTVVTITGSLLTGATAVSFGSTAAASFTVDSAMQITATTPAGTAGTADVSVTTAGGTAISAGAFTYVSDITRPTITLSGPAGPVTEPFRLTATFSEAVTGFDAADFTVANGTLSNFKEVTAGTVFTVLVTPVMGKTVSAGMPTKAVSDAAGNPNEASNRYSVKSGSVQAVFDSYKDDIRQIIQDQAEKRLTTLMNDNGRMMQDARTRFIGFAGTSESTAAGITPSGFEPIALDVDGTLEMSGDPAGIVAASSGTLLGQTGLINGANWRLSGNFDVLISDGESLAAFDGRVAREQFISHDILWDAFGGGQFSSSDIADAFNGTEPTWQLYAGLYGVAKLTDNLFADAYGSAGYGWSNVSMRNDELSLDGSYGTMTWQIGASLTGLIEMQRFSLLPTVSAAYGNSNIGEIDFTAAAYGLSDDISLNGSYVAMGVLRLTPEMRIPLGRESTIADGVTLGFLPSLICQQVVADKTDTECGWGAGVAFTQRGTTGLGAFSGRIEFEQVGGISRIGGLIGYALKF